MKPWYVATMLTIALVLIAGAPRLEAAEFSPALNYELERSGDTDFVSAIIILENPIDIQALDDKLHREKAPLDKRHRDVIAALKYNAETTQPAFRAELDEAKLRGEVAGYTAYWIENLFVVKAQKQFIESLRIRGDIRTVTENFRWELIEPIISHDNSDDAHQDDELWIPRNRPHNLDEELTTPGQDAIRATQVNRELGITGEGTLVADLDTGVDGDHPALATRWRGYNNAHPVEECWMDALGGQPDPTDTYGHGTHVMGTITGRAINGDDTITVGSAPNAQWIANNAINQGVGGEFDNDIIAAYEWFIDPDGDPQTLDDVPDVVQNSWRVNGGFPGYTECWEMWNTVILNCEAGGTVITWSAGNESTAGIGTPPNYSFNATQIFAVGAVDATNFDAPFPLAGFSSQGPTPCEPAEPNNIKPEIAAPGVDVYSCVPGGGYDGSWSGTSMAGPHVAGVVALMREACPSCDPTTIKEAIMETAVDEGYGPDGDDNQFGAGFIDAYEAVMLVMSLGEITGTVTRSTGQPLSDVHVTVEGMPRDDMTDEDGNYSIRLEDGTYDVTFERFGYITYHANGIVIETETVDTINVVMALAPSISISGHVYSYDMNPIPGAVVDVLNWLVDSDTTNAEGFYEILCPAGLLYELLCTADGHGANPQSIEPLSDVVVDFIMPQPVACYDFETDQGWTFGVTGDNATGGIWERGDPQQTSNGGGTPQPEDDHGTGAEVNCAVTGAVAGDNAGINDVDGGRTTLLSPVWDLSDFDFALLDIWSWYSNDLGNNPGTDQFVIEATSNGTTWTEVFSATEDWEMWRQNLIMISDFITLTSTVRVRIVASDESPASLVEAAVDDICILGGFDTTIPTPVLAVNPDTLNFGMVFVGDSAALDITLSSVGTDTLDITSVTVANGYHSTIPGTLTLAPGANAEYQVTFRPLAAQTYNGWLVIQSNSATAPDSVRLMGTSEINAVDPSRPVPTEFYLAQNYPNPFNPSTQIEFGLPASANVKISVYDILGRQVALLADGMLPAGVHRMEWDGSVHAAGLYLIKMESPNFNAVRKAMLLK